MWLAFVTSGRDKYEYNTEIVGLFTTQVLAGRALFRHLADAEQIFCGRYDDPTVELAFETVMKKLETMSIDQMTGIIEKHNDSYYNDGWSFHIDEIAIEK